MSTIQLILSLILFLASLVGCRYIIVENTESDIEDNDELINDNWSQFLHFIGMSAVVGLLYLVYNTDLETGLVAGGVMTLSVMYIFLEKYLKQGLREISAKHKFFLLVLLLCMSCSLFFTIYQTLVSTYHT